MNVYLIIYEFFKPWFSREAPWKKARFPGNFVHNSRRRGEDGKEHRREKKEAGLGDD